MNSIRPIRDNELDAFLRVLCDAFDLDFHRARDPFRREPFFDLNRKWAFFENGRIVSILTTVPVMFGDGPAIGIAGVATVKTHRRRGFAKALLSAALDDSEKTGVPRALLFANMPTLYELIGFRILDRVVTQPLPPQPVFLHQEPVPEEEVQQVYEGWAADNPARLRRDETRWAYWRWSVKSPVRIPGGYACLEPGRIRELLPEYKNVPVSQPMEFFGLESMAKLLRIPLSSPATHTLLMGRNMNFIPQMFMSDQF